ncbi:MAG: S-methyl-5-thioribose-1-phosphate isomerase [Candidatus Saganbacteria bacterium]|nr:S-methyl-5-thioribose-1-phosphate isomerase [Candidatus Saganbacteria bacterium]
MKDLCPVKWKSGKVRIIDQTKLPFLLKYLDIDNPKDMEEAIRSMAVRGAPALGIASAFSLVLGAKKLNAKSPDEFLKKLRRLAKEIRSIRPTAVSPSQIIDKMLETAIKNKKEGIEKIRRILFLKARRFAEDSFEAERKMGEIGAKLIRRGDRILTYCNAGALATAGYGTALGVIRAAKAKKIHVFVPETRPKLQGARLTAFELKEYGIPATLITDSMIAYFMYRRSIDIVLVGADRIAANGDTANKIGTCGIAVLAKENKIPFFIVAPFDTIDMKIKNGSKIQIEKRDPKEVTHIFGERIAPDGIAAENPAFDITQSRYITGIITEKGTIKPPYVKNIRLFYKK